MLEDTTKGSRTQWNKRTSGGNNIENKWEGAWGVRMTAETNNDNNKDDEGPSPENDRDDEETEKKP